MPSVVRFAAGVLTAVALAACSGTPASRGASLPPVTPIMIPPPMATADASSLAGPVWQWAEAGASPERYTLQFMDDGRVLVRADCNRGSGRYAADASGTLSLSSIALTKMGCPAGSLDTTFVRELGEVAGYRVEAGTLRLALRGGGDMTFRS